MLLMLNVSFTFSRKKDTKGAKEDLFEEHLEVAICPSRAFVLNLIFLFFNWVLFNYYCYFYPVSSVHPLLQQPRSAEHGVLVWASLETINDTDMTLNMTAT